MYLQLPNITTVNDQHFAISHMYYIQILFLIVIVIITLALILVQFIRIPSATLLKLINCTINPFIDFSLALDKAILSILINL